MAYPLGPRRAAGLAAPQGRRGACRETDVGCTLRYIRFKPFPGPHFAPRCEMNLGRARKAKRPGSLLHARVQVTPPAGLLPQKGRTAGLARRHFRYGLGSGQLC